MSQVVEITVSEGLTSLSAKAYADGSDTLAGTASAAVYATNRKGLVAMTFTGLAVGVYRFELLDSVGVVSVRHVKIDAADGLWTEYASQEALLDAIAAVTSVTLTGPYTRTVTVTDSVTSQPIQGATVKFSRAGHTESKPANADGVASFTVAAETWTYSVSYNNYTGQTGSIAVSASGDTPISLVALAAATPAEAPQTNVQLPTEDQYGARKANVTVKFTFLSHAEGATITGTIVNTPAPRTSDSDGICRVVLRRLANYKAEFTIPGDRVPKTKEFTTGNTGVDIITD